MARGRSGWCSLPGRASGASILSAALLFALCAPMASADTVACHCYCGINVRAPCGDEDCKRACGYREPSPGGGTSAPSPAQAIGNAISSGIQEGLRRAREQERIRMEQEQQALQQNRAMMRSLDQTMRAQVEADDAEKRAAAERERLLEARRRDETLSGLAGLPGTDDLALKPSTSFFGSPGNPAAAPPSDPSVVDLSHLPPDQPIVVDPAALKAASPPEGRPLERGETDCARAKAARDRLAAGLPVQEEAIRRTEAQLAAAAKDVVAARAEGRQVLVKGAMDEVKGYAQGTLSTVRALRGQVEALGGLDRVKRDALLRSLNALAFGGEDLLEAARAGHEAGEGLRKKQDSLARQVKELADKGLLESGILEKVGEAAAGRLWGPLGELSFRGAKLSIDLGVAVGQGVISESERETARSHLATMRAEHGRVKRRIAELDAEDARSCRK